MFILITSSYGYVQDTFTNGETSEDIPFDGELNTVRNIAIPKLLNVTSSSFKVRNISGTFNFDFGYCYQEFANESPCGQSSNGSYLYSQPFYPNNNNVADGDYDTNATSVNGFFSRMIVTYVIPDNVNLKKSFWQVKHYDDTAPITFNTTLPQVCIDYAESVGTLDVWVDSDASPTNITLLSCTRPIMVPRR